MSRRLLVLDCKPIHVLGYLRLRLSRWACIVLASVVLFNAVPLVAQDSAPSGYRAFKLAHARADDVVDDLKNILGSDTEVLIDRKMNRVLVRGGPGTDELIADLIRTIDRPHVAARPEKKPQGKSVVKGYATAIDDLEAVASELRAHFRTRSDLRIATDHRAGQIIVVAPAEVQTQIDEMLANRTSPSESSIERRTFDLRGTPQPETDHLHQLQNLTWREFEDRLEEIWGSRLTFATYRNGELAVASIKSQPNQEKTSLHIDRRRNFVSVDAGDDDDLAAWEKMIQLVDEPSDVDQKTAFVALQGADADDMRKAAGLLESLSKEQEKNVAASIVRLADRQKSGGRLLSQIFRPASQVAEVAQAQPGLGLNQPPADAGAEADGGLIGPVQIEVLEATGQIIIRGNPRDVERVQQIIQEIIDVAQLTRPEVKVYRLKHLNSQAVAELVSQLYAQVYEPRLGPVSIIALVSPNALLLVGSEENIASVESLVGQLDQPVPAAAQFEVFQLRYMSAVDAETRINSFFAAQEDAQAAADDGLIVGLTPRVQVVSDYRSNSLVVRASPSDLAEVAEFLRKIDVIDGPSVNEVKIFPLRNALAEELAPVLQDALNGQLQGAGQGLTGQVTGQQQLQAQIGQQQFAQVRSAVLSLMTVDRENGRLIKSGIMFDVRVTADLNSNSLIVTGPAQNMELIGALIDQLDQLPSAEAQIKVFTIINGDATTLLDMLETLFGQVQVGGAQAGALGQLPLQAGAGETSLVTLRFAIDVRTNSIIASGSEGDLNVVEALLARLDLEEIEDRNTTVYRLRNAPALDVATAITDFLDSQRDINQLDPSIISPFEQIEREVVVVPELVSNSLIVSAIPQYFDDIKRIIEELDRRPPMIMIQVLIAEVFLDKTEELGVELGIQDSLLFDRGIANLPELINNSIGFPFNQAGIGNNNDATSLATRDAVTGQALANFSVGRANMNLGYGGLVLSAGNDSVNVLIRALLERGRAQILSRPQVMTLDNLGAFVQVGQRVARVTTVTQNVGGGTTFGAPDVNVGILLGVTPRTSPDGLIVMEINAEKSELGDEADGTPIFVDADGRVIRSPPINTTLAQTTVSARSGQTVVFAGLITKDEFSVRRGIPVISDWPLVGPLFRYDGYAMERSELLIILTPWIIDDDEDVEWINNREAERMSWCLSDVVEVHGDSALIGGGYGFDGGAQPEVVYPDYDPTGTEGGPIPSDEQGLPLNQLPNPVDQSSRRAGPAGPRSTPAVGPPLEPIAGRAPLDQSASSRLPSWWRARLDPRLQVGPEVVSPKVPTTQYPGYESPRISRLPTIK